MTAAFVAAVAVLALVARPPARLALVPAAPADGTIAGAFHIHTNRSDGRGSPEDVARDAARAGLSFVVFTDHGDGMRTPDPPTYRDGVLCLDGVEISTAGGHYIALGMPAAPYPLGGEARDVVDDVRRLGGFGIVAHPDSPKQELAWRDWTLPVDGVEVVNLDTGWRRRVDGAGWRGTFSLVRALAGYPLRPSETLAGLVAATAVLKQYDTISSHRSIVALAGADAHAKLSLFDSEPGNNRFSLPFPGYASVFRALSIRIRLDRPLNGDAAADGAAILTAIRGGRLYTVVEGLASPPSFEFTAERGDDVVREGGRLRPAGEPVLFRVRSNAPAPFTTLIRTAAKALAAGNGPELTVRTAEPGAYRAEIRHADRTGERTWLLSNPIYIGDEEPAPREAEFTPQGSRPLYSGGDGKNWNVEVDSRSKAGLEVTSAPNRQLKLTYQLADGPPSGQFIALAQGTPGGIAPFDRIAFTGRAGQPMRISVQLRVENSPGRTDRWQRSIVLDAATKAYVVPFAEMTPVGEVEGSLRPAQVHSVMFVVELTNTKPGSAGAIWLGDVQLEH